MLTASSLPPVTAPAIYAGDFNCQHPDWGCNYTTQDGRTLSDWASNAEALLLFDPKEPPSFFSACWNTNPDLAFAVCSSNDPKPERRVIGRFSCSHHRPSVIKVPSLVQPVAGKPVKRWNFRKANWQSYAAETERRSAGLLDPEAADVDTAYTAYCKVQRRTTSRVASTRTTSRAGTMSAAAFCTTTSRPAPGKKWMRLQQHYFRSWTSPEGPGGLKP